MLATAMPQYIACDANRPGVPPGRRWLEPTTIMTMPVMRRLKNGNPISAMSPRNHDSAPVGAWTMHAPGWYEVYGTGR